MMESPTVTPAGMQEECSLVACAYTALHAHLGDAVGVFNTREPIFIQDNPLLKKLAQQINTH